MFTTILIFLLLKALKILFLHENNAYSKIALVPHYIKSPLYLTKADEIRWNFEGQPLNQKLFQNSWIYNKAI